MFRKLTAILISAVWIVLLCGCSVRGGHDYSSLERRLKKEDKSFAYDTDRSYFDCGAYYFYYSFRSPDDLLLKLPVDEAHLLTGAAVTVRNAGVLTPKEEFMKMCAVVLAEFFPEDALPEIIEQTGLYRDDNYFSENGMLTYRGEELSAVLLMLPQAVTFAVIPCEEEEPSV